MKKAIFTLAILAMALGNAAFAQGKAKLKSEATQSVLKHYGVRDNADLVPLKAIWNDSYGNTSRITYTYDEYDYYLLEEFYESDEGDGWNDMGSITYTYDFAGNVTELLSMYADDGEMLPDAKVTYTYQAGELNEVVYQYWNNGTWTNSMKGTYTYNDDVTTILYWSWSGSNWSSSDLYTYTYGTSTIELVMQYMEGGAWQNEARQVFTLNFDEQVTEILEQTWQGTNWVNDELTTYHYDGNVFPLKTIEEWDGTSWTDDYKFEYVHDADGNAIQGVCLKVEGNQWVSADNDIEMVFGNGRNEYYGISVEVDYFDVTNLKENAATIGAEVFPIPAQGVINIKAADFAKAEVYNTAGQKVLSSALPQIDTEALASGLYIIKVYDRNGGMATLKVTVK